MLVLSRKQDQEIHLPEYGIRFRVLGVSGKRVRIGIDAPDDVRIIRNELAFEPDEALSTPAEPAEYLDPDYVWPLGVRYVPDRAITHSRRRHHHRQRNPFAVAEAADSEPFAPSLSH